jgi:hypothetical protein
MKTIPLTLLACFIVCLKANAVIQYADTNSVNAVQGNGGLVPIIASVQVATNVSVGTTNSRAISKPVLSIVAPIGGVTNIFQIGTSNSTVAFYIDTNGVANGNAAGMTNFPPSVVSTNGRFTWTFFPKSGVLAYTNSLPPGTVPYSYSFVMITVTNSPATGYTTNSGCLDVNTVLNAPGGEVDAGPVTVALYFDRVTNMIVTFGQNPQTAGWCFMSPSGTYTANTIVLTNWDFQVRVQQ